MRMELAACGFTCLVRGDGAEQSKFCVGAEVCGFLSGRGFAEVDVLMPVRDAERDALVQLILRSVDAVGVHGADELVSTVSRFLVEQRGRLEGIEVRTRLESKLVLCKVVLGLRNIRKKNLVTVRQRLAVVLVRSHCLLCRGNDCVGLLLVAWL